MKVESLCEPEALTWLERVGGVIPYDRAIVECGVHQGASIAAVASNTTAQVHGFDPWGQVDGIYQGRPHMLKRYTSEDEQIAHHYLRSLNLHRTVTLHRATAEQGAAEWDGPKVGLLVIDAEHKRKPVLNDYRAWRPHLDRGALVAFDDHCDRFPGVVEAVDSIVRWGQLERVELVGTRFYVTRFVGA